MKNESLVAIIPARSGSKRIPSKNIIDFFGHPLIAYTIAAAINSKLFDKVIVTTDSPEIGEIAEWYGAEYLHRPLNLATDSSGLVDVALHVLSVLEADSFEIDSICQLMPNCPLRLSFDIVEQYSFFKKNNHVFQISTVPYRGVYPQWALIEKEDGTGKWLLGENHLVLSQQLEKTSCPTGAIWWADANEFKQQRKFYGLPFHLFVMDANRGIDIDTLEDLKFTKLLVKGLSAQNLVSPLESISQQKFAK